MSLEIFRYFSRYSGGFLNKMLVKNCECCETTAEADWGIRSIRGIAVPVLISLRINKRHGYISHSLGGSLNIRAIPVAYGV